MEELLVALGQHEAAWDQCRQVSDEKKKNALDESQKILHQVMTSVMASSTSAIGQIDKAFTLNGNRSPRRLVAHFLYTTADFQQELKQRLELLSKKSTDDWVYLARAYFNNKMYDRCNVVCQKGLTVGTAVAHGTNVQLESQHNIGAECCIMLYHWFCRSLTRQHRYRLALEVAETGLRKYCDHPARLELQHDRCVLLIKLDPAASKIAYTELVQVLSQPNPPRCAETKKDDGADLEVLHDFTPQQILTTATRELARFAFEFAQSKAGEKTQKTQPRSPKRTREEDDVGMAKKKLKVVKKSDVVGREAAITFLSSLNYLLPSPTPMSPSSSSTPTPSPPPNPNLNSSPSPSPSPMPSPMLSPSPTPTSSPMPNPMPTSPTKPLSLWSSHDVVQWIRQQDERTNTLQPCFQILVDHGMDGSVLIELNAQNNIRSEDLEDLGLSAYHASMLSDKLKDLLAVTFITP